MRYPTSFCTLTALAVAVAVALAMPRAVRTAGAGTDGE
jgi:hypothetical protein